MNSEGNGFDEINPNYSMEEKKKNLNDARTIHDKLNNICTEKKN